jgi:hypothetical protein
MGEHMENEQCKAWVVSINMGLGHQRATHALLDIAEEGVLLVGEKETSSPEEIKLWHRITGGYELISRIKKIPISGSVLFSIMDKFMAIAPIYPLRDMSKPGFQTKLIYHYIKKGLGKSLMKKIETKSLPLICSYPVPALIADYYNYGRNYCIVTDAEINRAWVPKEPAASRTVYMAPCSRALQRLRQYGVLDERIFLTGFPLPKTILGTEKLEILRHDLGQRLHYLDPQKKFWPLHELNVKHFLGKQFIHFKNERLFSIAFAVGGAGAQTDIGLKIAKSLKEKILKKELKFYLIAGVREEVKTYFEHGLKDLGLSTKLVPIIYSQNTLEYFDEFSKLMRVIDVLWTKPSELIFYAALGLPIIMSDPIGSQEGYNKKWLLEIQAGITQEDPEYANEWLIDLWKYGRLAESAWDGFLKARKFGTYKIYEVLRTGTMIRETSPLRR